MIFSNVEQVCLKMLKAPKCSKKSWSIVRFESDRFAGFDKTNLYRWTGDNPHKVASLTHMQKLTNSVTINLCASFPNRLSIHIQQTTSTDQTKPTTLPPTLPCPESRAFATLVPRAWASLRGVRASTCSFKHVRVQLLGDPVERHGKPLLEGPMQQWAWRFVALPLLDIDVSFLSKKQNTFWCLVLCDPAIAWYKKDLGWWEGDWKGTGIWSSNSTCQGWIWVNRPMKLKLKQSETNPKFCK